VNEPIKDIKLDTSKLEKKSEPTSAKLESRSDAELAPKVSQGDISMEEPEVPGLTESVDLVPGLDDIIVEPMDTTTDTTVSTSGTTLVAGHTSPINGADDKAVDLDQQKEVISLIEEDRSIDQDEDDMEVDACKQRHV
jgi:hypothetical protein